MLKDDIENIVASACDGTWNGLEGAYFPEYNNPPQKLADKLVAYIERLLTQRALDGATCPAHGEPVSNLIHFACGCSQEPPRQ